MYFDAYYSDPHYFHNNIIKYCNRPYKDFHHMNEMLIMNYNEKITTTDTVLWLGDCFFTKEQSSRKSIMNRLNGKKILLRGNHDKKISDLMFNDLGFETIYDTHFLDKIENHLVRYSHFPHYELEGDQRYRNLRPPIENNVTLIHGHTHEKNKINSKNHIHVGVDAWEYGPALYNEILNLLNEIKKDEKK